jgi:F-type H+-transporting ATPase subunit a
MTSEISTYKRFSSICFVIFALFISLSFDLNASEPIEPEAHEVVTDSSHAAGAHAVKARDPNAPVDITAIALEHVADSHSWHLWGEGHDAVALPLPIILYSSTKGLQVFSSARFEHGHASYNGYSLVEEKVISEDATESVFDISITKNVTQMLFSAFLLFLKLTEQPPKATTIIKIKNGFNNFFSI